MKTFLKMILIGMFLATLGCASHNKKTGHHHHLKACDKDSCKMDRCEMYEKRCAYSVSNGNMNVKAKDEYQLKHAGHTYYFSSEKKMDEFKKDLEGNVNKANENWGAFKWQQLKR